MTYNIYTDHVSKQLFITVTSLIAELVIVKLFVVLYSEIQAKIESNMPTCVGRISSVKEFNLIHRGLISQYMNSF